jgi:hypothetical protein
MGGTCRVITISSGSQKFNLVTTRRKGWPFEGRLDGQVKDINVASL